MNIAPDTIPDAIATFEQVYIAVRDIEGRLYTDEQVAQLPDIDTGHLYYKEWKMRKYAALQLIAFLEKQGRPLNILEIGCGNGWLSAKLAGIPKANVTGIDANRVELKQAARVFTKRNLQFINTAFSANTFARATKFDAIIFAASVQYFPSLVTVINDAFQLLNPEGRVHIIDTHFYHTREMEIAAGRSKDYFTLIGYPQMAQYYFHHPLKQAMHFKHKIMFDPATFLNKLIGKSIFYWIKLKP